MAKLAMEKAGVVLAAEVLVATEMACSDGRSQAAAPEAPGGMTGIGHMNSSGSGSVMAAIARRGMAVISSGTKELGSDSGRPGPGNSSGDGSNGAAGTDIVGAANCRLTGMVGSIGNGAPGMGSDRALGSE